MVFVVDDYAQRFRNEAATRFFAAVESLLECPRKDETLFPQVGFDCEGVNLCRAGTLELVSLFFPTTASAAYGHVFIVDLSQSQNAHDSLFRADRVWALKRLLESNTVVKVIHDCRMDSDALYFLEGICLTNVHDTSCYHTALTGYSDVNLNTLLQHYGLAENTTRDKMVYKQNPLFWSIRPLTKTMVDWASSDVNKLILVAEQQNAQLLSSGSIPMAREKSKWYAECMRCMKLRRNVECRIPPRFFIGPKGSNIRSLQESTGTLIYQDFDGRVTASNSQPKWLVFYSDERALDDVTRYMTCKGC